MTVIASTSRTCRCGEFEIRINADEEEPRDPDVGIFVGYFYWYIEDDESCDCLAQYTEHEREALIAQVSKDGDGMSGAAWND